MDQRWLPRLAAAMVVSAGWVISAAACPGEDARSAQTAVAAKEKPAACTPAMAAQCTPAQAAACKAKGGAVTAGAKEAHLQVAMEGGGKSCCATKGAATANAKKKNADEFDAVLTGSGGSCKGQGMAKAAGEYTHSDCDACADMALCNADLKSASGQTQAVPLKNGVMYLYTAEGPSQIRNVQAAMARRNQRWNALMASGDKARLCSECKAMRGAAASGKLTREVVNIEGGCLTLITSTDPAIVTKLHAFAGTPTATRIKT
jgi:hypothetical protein